VGTPCQSEYHVPGSANRTNGVSGKFFEPHGVPDLFFALPQSQMSRAIEVLLSALTSDSVALAKEYVAFVLSIDGLQHPLLRGATCLPPRNEVSGDYEFSSDNFLELRLSLLQGTCFGPLLDR